jgi:hypothetical protein
VDAALKIHMELGPGLLESVYKVVLARALEKQGFHVERQKVIRFEYDGMVFEEKLGVRQHFLSFFRFNYGMASAASSIVRQRQVKTARSN